MRKVTIKKLPEMKRGGTSYPNIPMQIAPWSVHNTAGAPLTESRKSVEHDYENPNIEAEGGETILDPNVNGLPAHFNINGPSHADGGVPMRATEDSFIFSKFLKMPKDVAEYFELPIKKGKSKTSKYSYADAAKKYGSVINDARKVMADPNATKMDISTAELNIKNAIDKLGQVSLAQEASKGYEDGIPALAMPYLMRVGADPSALMPMAEPRDYNSEEIVTQQGGLQKAQSLGSISNMMQQVGYKPINKPPLEYQMESVGYKNPSLIPSVPLQMQSVGYKSVPDLDVFQELEKAGFKEPASVYDEMWNRLYNKQQGGELPKAQRGKVRRMQRRINDLYRSQSQPRIITDRNTGMTYVVDGYGNIMNTPFGSQQPATSRTTTVKFKPNETATIITRNKNESDPDFQKRVREEFGKAKNKQEVYVVKADGGYQKVTKTSVAKKLPESYVSDPRLGKLNNDYADIEATLKDPANKGIVDRMYEEYKRQIDASNLSASRKAELKKKGPEEVLDNFLKAQKQVFAITKAELEDKSINPITGDKSWDKGGSNKNKIYKETLKKIGFKDDEIFNDDQIAMFQAAYKGVQAAADDPEYKATLERFTLNPRGMSDQQDAAGRAISPVDDIFGNTTAGQGLFLKNLKEDGVAFEDVQDQTITEEQPKSPTYTRSQPDLQYWGPDVNNMAANLAIGANQPNVMPASFPMAPVSFNQAYLDPSREVAETQGTAQGALRAAGVYGSPQGYAAAAASTQAQAANNIANTLGKYFNANNEIYNNAERTRADLAFKTNAYNLENAKRYYDEITQKIENDKQTQNEFIAQTTALKNAMDVNAATSANLESISGDRFRIDEPSGLVYFNKGKKLTGQEKFDQYESQLARMNDLMKRGVSADKAAQVIFGGKGINVEDPGNPEVEMFNELLQQYNMGNPQAAAALAQYSQAAGTGALPYMFGGLI